MHISYYISIYVQVKGIEGWENTLEFYSGVSIANVESVANNLLEMLQKPAKESFLYTHNIYLIREILNKIIKYPFFRFFFVKNS